MTVLINKQMSFDLCRSFIDLLSLCMCVHDGTKQIDGIAFFFKKCGSKEIHFYIFI